MIRGPAGAAPPLEAIRREVAGVDAQLALYEARTMDAIRAENIEQDRVGAWTASLLAAAGLVLAGVGLYAVLAFVVAGDRREIAVRLALGASRRSVLRLVLGRGLRLTATGLLAGSVVAWFASVTASSWLTIVEPDARIIALAAGVLFIAALLATAGPALRALRIDAVSVLRSD
jgi:ABC-type antimicrobial peptide transport system permease subunit